MRYFWILILMLFFADLQAQTISGQVKDAKTQKPLNGVSISFKKGTGGSTTDVNGQFSLTLSDPTDTVVFSHVGYQTHYLPVEQTLAFTSILLQPAATELKGIRVLPEGFFEDWKNVPTTQPNLVRAFNNTSPQETLNTIPGVRMDSRGYGGSRRLNIRGSALRSPFGVRNVRMYWNNIPLTSPDGSSPLEIIDMEGISSMEILKGPTAGVYGGWNGGTALFYSTHTPYDRARLNISSTAGDYGLLRYAASGGINKEKFRFDAGFIHQDYDGYRQQSYNGKDFFQFSGHVRLANNHYLDLAGFVYDGTWALPGAINATTVDTAPQSANPFALANDTRVSRKRARIGLSYLGYVKGFQMRHTLYGNTTSKLNPYGTSAFYNGFKDEKARGWGSRHEFRRTVRFPKRYLRLSHRLLFGFEQQQETNDLQDFELVDGNKGVLEVDNSTRSKFSTAFLQTDTKHDRLKNTTLTAALVLSSNSYDHTDLFTADNIDYSGKRKFKPQLLHRLGITQKFLRKQVVYADLATGYSAPALWEVSNFDGSFNQQIQAETSRVLEAGLRLALLKDKLNITTSVYNMQLTNAIVPQIDTTGMPYFNNSGKVAQKGAELSMKYTLRSDLSKNLSLIHLRFSAAYQDYIFSDYTKEGVVLDGNEVTGIPRETVTGGLDIGMKFGVYANFSWMYTSAIPLNDLNTAYADAYHLLHARAGYRGAIAKRMRYEVFGGVQNILNTEYSSFLQLNGFNGQYFNPSPLRNVYGGVSLKFNLLK